MPSCDFETVFESNLPPPSRALPPRKEKIVAHHGLRRAGELAVMVRDESRESIAAYLDVLDRQHLYAVIVALAALVPDDVPQNELLAWLQPIDQQLELGLEAVA